jgi:hypothetical protein
MSKTALAIGTMMLVLASPLASQDDSYFLYANCPLTRLIALPQTFDGKLIKVVGYFTYSQENGPVLYPTAEHARVSIFPDSVDLAFNQSFDSEDLQALSGKYLQVFGRFDSHPVGDGAGVIREIYKVVGWFQ